jgi:hypothetical protein
MKPTDLSRLVGNLPQAGKINNLRQACEISGCVNIPQIDVIKSIIFSNRKCEDSAFFQYSLVKSRDFSEKD